MASRIAFFSAPDTPQLGAGLTQDLFAVPSAGGTPARLLERPGPQWADSWSPDGRFLLFDDGPGYSRDLWVLPDRRRAASPSSRRGSTSGVACSRPTAARSRSSATSRVATRCTSSPSPDPGPKVADLDQRGLAAGVGSQRTRAVLPRRRLADGRAGVTRSVSGLGTASALRDADRDLQSRSVRRRLRRGAPTAASCRFGAKRPPRSTSCSTGSRSCGGPWESRDRARPARSTRATRSSSGTRSGPRPRRRACPTRCRRVPWPARRRRLWPAPPPG